MKTRKIIAALCTAAVIAGTGALGITAYAEGETAAADTDSETVTDFDIDAFTKGVWSFSTRAPEDHIVTDPEGYICFFSATEGYMFFDITGTVDYFTCKPDDEMNIIFDFDSLDDEAAMKITAQESDYTEAFLSANGNTPIYTFNYIGDNAEEFFEEHAGDGLVPEELYDVDGADEIVEEDEDAGMVPEELYDVDGADANAANPGTGVGDFAAPLTAAGIFGLAGIAAYRLKKTK